LHAPPLLLYFYSRFSTRNTQGRHGNDFARPWPSQRRRTFWSSSSAMRSRWRQGSAAPPRCATAHPISIRFAKRFGTPLLLKRQCGRTPGGPRPAGVCRGGGGHPRRVWGRLSLLGRVVRGAVNEGRVWTSTVAPSLLDKSRSPSHAVCATPFERRPKGGGRTARAGSPARASVGRDAVNGGKLSWWGAHIR
jgi:hypothetical protein